MQLFVLRHAEQILRSGDSDTLLACELRERDYQKHKISDSTITPWWAIAAARLNPKNGSRILKEAVKQFHRESDSNERAMLCAEMWRMCGKSEMKFIINWFYNESPERATFPNCQTQFIKDMSKEVNGREVIVELIKNKRMDDLDWQSLERLVRAVNGWTKKPVVTKEEICKAWHPLGSAYYHWEKEKAKKDYPKETKNLEMILNDWKKRLRMSI